MKVLWQINSPLVDTDGGGTGTWLGAMAKEILGAGTVELGVIALGPVSQVTQRDLRQVHQWVVPAGVALGPDGMPPECVVQKIQEITAAFAPDMVHTWGTESFFGLLAARGMVKVPALLEIQGLKGPYAQFYYGGLTFPEQLRCIGIKEILKRRTMHFERRDFAKWGLLEAEIIRGHAFIDIQSPWVAAHVTAANASARQYSIDLMLREPFYGTPDWEYTGDPTLFCTAAYPVPYKGLHVAVRSLARLRKRIPGARLRVAGAHQRPGLRQEGYMRWVNRMVQELGVGDAIDWLGPLDGREIVHELRGAAAALIPTFIENCCTAMQEAMAIGTPVVVSFVGGIPSLARDEESCLFFPPDDDALCAFQLERAITDGQLAGKLAVEARKIAALRNDRGRILARQLHIYDEVVGHRNPTL